MHICSLSVHHFHIEIAREALFLLFKIIARWYNIIYIYNKLSNLPAIV